MAPSSKARRLAPLTVLSVVAVVMLAVGLAGPATGFNPQPEPPAAHTPPLTIKGPDDSLQVHAVNLGVNTCHVTGRVSDAAGDTLMTTDARLAPGEVGTEVFAPTGTEVVYSWYTWRSLTDRRGCQVATSVEVTDRDGATKLMVPGRALPFDPQGGRQENPGR